MTPLTSLLVIVALAACAAKTRHASSMSDKEKMFTVWFRSDASHFRHVVREPIGTVWEALPATFQFLQFPGAASVYADEFVYFTPSLKIERRLYEGEANSLYLNCGFTSAGTPAADAYEVIFAVLARLTPNPAGGTEIDIIVDGTARNLAERSEPVSCGGTGRLESIIVQRLEELLRTRAH